MSSYNRETSKKNKLVIDVLINQLLRNLIGLGITSREIAEKVITQYPEIKREDEERTSAREEEERQRYVDENAGDCSESYRREIRREAEKKIRKRRIVDAFTESQSYMRLSHNLFVNFNESKPDGYHWSKFYERENDEPFTEKAMREAITDEVREQYRHAVVCKIISYTYPYWPIIKDRNINFLTDHFSAMFPNSDFTDKLEIIYGNNDMKKNYVSEDDLDSIWAYIHGIIKLCIKYMYYTERKFFNLEEEGKVVDVDYESDILLWDVNLNVRTDNLEMWEDI